MWPIKIGVLLQGMEKNKLFKYSYYYEKPEPAYTHF